MSVAQRILDSTDTTFASRDVLAVVAAVIDAGYLDRQGLQTLLADLGLAAWEPYDPGVHGEVEGVEPGDQILAYAAPLKGALGLGRERLAARYAKAPH